MCDNDAWDSEDTNMKLDAKKMDAESKLELFLANSRIKQLNKKLLMLKMDEKFKKSDFQLRTHACHYRCYLLKRKLGYARQKNPEVSDSNGWN